MSDTAQTGDATGANSQNSGAVKVEFTAEQQAVIDKAISERLKRAEEQWQAKQADAVKAAEDAAELKRLEENNQFKELYEKSKSDLQAMYSEKLAAQQIAGTLEQYQQTIGEMLTARVAALGDAAKNAVDNLPGEPDALGKLRWLNKNEGLFSKTVETPKPGGTPPRYKGMAIQQPQQTNQPAVNEPPLIRL